MSNPIKVGRFSALNGASYHGNPPEDYREIFIRQITNFARWTGLRVLPPATNAKLNEKNGYYIFCFSTLISDPISLINGSMEGQIKKERYLELLKDPALETKADLFRGLQALMGNFTCYMPDGTYREMFRDNPDYFQDKKEIFKLIDRILAKRGLKDKEAELRSAAQSEKPIIVFSSLKNGDVPAEYFDKRIEYFKFCLTIFELLVKKYTVDPKTLWH